MNADKLTCEPAPSLKEYRAKIGNAVCRWDGVKLPETIDTYDHRWGWPVDGMEGLQWLSIQCPRCHYEWSINKLGIPQP